MSSQTHHEVPQAFPYTSERVDRIDGWLKRHGWKIFLAESVWALAILFLAAREFLIAAIVCLFAGYFYLRWLVRKHESARSKT